MVLLVMPLLLLLPLRGPIDLSLQLPLHLYLRYPGSCYYYCSSLMLLQLITLLDLLLPLHSNLP